MSCALRSNHFSAPLETYNTRRTRMTEVLTAPARGLTNGDVLAKHRIGSDGIEHLDLPVPLITGMQAQGDVLIVPTDPRQDRGEAVPVKGIAVVSGESTGGNAHILHNLDGGCFWQPSPDAGEELVQGWLTVPEGSSATLLHTAEHSVLGVGPGTFEIRRQREFAGQWRRLSD